MKSAMVTWFRVTDTDGYSDLSQLVLDESLSTGSDLFSPGKGNNESDKYSVIHYLSSVTLINRMLGTTVVLIIC